MSMDCSVSPTRAALLRRYREARARLASRAVGIQPKPSRRDWLIVTTGNVSWPRNADIGLAPALFHIKRAVSEATGISKIDMESPRRLQSIIDARHVYFWLARELTACSFPQIGKSCGKDHTTVMHGIDKVNSDMPAYAAIIKAVKIKLGVPV